jgi:hypothetical protein
MGGGKDRFKNERKEVYEPVIDTFGSHLYVLTKKPIAIG